MLIKTIFKILAIAGIVLFTFFTTLLIGLNINSVQNYFVKIATKQLSNKLETTVSVDNIDYRLFNTFRLHNFYIEDNQKDTLLYVKQLNINFSFWKLFRKKLVTHKVEVDNLDFKYLINKKGENNFDFIIDAFQSDKDKNSPFEFNLNNIQITNSSFTYKNNHSYKKIENKNKFNISDFYLKNLTLNLNIDYLKKDSLNGSIKNLSFLEKSGFSVKKMRAKVSGLKKGIQISDWEFQLPKSKIKLNNLSLKYDTISALNHFVDKVTLEAKLAPSKIFFPDFSPFIPQFKRLTSKVQLRCQLRGKISNFRISNFLLIYENSTFLKGNIDFNGINNIDEAFLFADVKDLYLNRMDLQDIIAKLNNQPFQLPKEFNRLGDIEYKGNISGFFNNLISYGNIFTDLGNIKTDISLKFTNKMRDLRYSGAISTTNFQLGRLINNKILGSTSFTFKTKGQKLAKHPLKGVIKGNLKRFYFSNYLYKNIQLDGNYSPKGFEGRVGIDDKNISAIFYGLVDISQKIPRFNFDLKIDKANLNELQLTQKHPNTLFSFTTNAKLRGNSIDDLDGAFKLDSLTISNQKESFFLDTLKLDIFQLDSTQTNLVIKSNIINGKLKGDFRYSTLKYSFFTLLHQYLPSLTSQKLPKIENNNQFELDLKIKKLNNLTKVLNLPFRTDSTTFIKGYLNEKINHINFHVNTHDFKFKKRKIKNLHFNINNSNNLLDISLLGNYILKDDSLKIQVSNQAKKDSIYTNIKWNTLKKTNYLGEIKSQTTFNKNKINIHFLPSEIILADSIWNMYESKLDISNNWAMNIQHFKIGNNKQYISANGWLSHLKEDFLEVNLKRVDLDFIISLFNLKGVELDGKITGNSKLYQVFQNPILESNLEIKDAKLNGTLLGKANLSSKLNDTKEQLLVSGNFEKKSGKVANVSGFYNLKNSAYDFFFDIKELDLSFLHLWLKTMVSNISGKATGLVRMFGDAKGISFESNAFLEKAKFTVGFLNTTYSFTDTVFLRKKSIEIKNVTIYDKYKNKGLVDALVLHDGNFKDFQYNLNLTTKSMMVLDKPNRDEIPFFGQAFMTGSANIFGSQKEMATHINVNAKTEKKTHIHIIAEEGGKASDNSFITFIKKKKNLRKKEKTVNLLPTNKNNLLFKISLTATPEAKVELLLDSHSGDKISANGTGNIRLDYNSAQKNIDIYGNYTIEKGNFLFSLQDLISKEFKIVQGSNIVWSGDILKANLNIHAIYSLKASLSDLINMNMISSSMTRSNVPVNCLLHLENELIKPKITFDIDFPASDETLKMQFKNLISTEDMLNRQFLYLLVFDRFYADNSISQSNNNSGSEWGLLNSILTGQINSWLSKLNQNVTFGFNYRTSHYGQEVSQEYETTINYQPNDQLIINGNFGYRDDQLIKDKVNKIIGDVDIEYIFTENHKWRIKAYNHTVDRYSLRSVPFVQGVGIMYKKDFDNWRELWNDLLRRKEKKETKLEP